jgi:hypothetical protein
MMIVNSTGSDCGASGSEDVAEAEPAAEKPDDVAPSVDGGWASDGPRGLSSSRSLLKEPPNNRVQCNRGTAKGWCELENLEERQSRRAVPLLFDLCVRP